MSTKPERGLRELYADPERADFERWGRRAVGTDRRGFLKGAGLAAMERFLRAGIPMARYMPAGLIPVPGWNPRGYLNNACHRIAVRAV